MAPKALLSKFSLVIMCLKRICSSRINGSRFYKDCFVFQYVQNNKESDNDWFRLESNKDGTRWFGKCWYIHELLKYEFDVEFDVSICRGQWEFDKPELYKSIDLFYCCIFLKFLSIGRCEVSSHSLPAIRTGVLLII